MGLLGQEVVLRHNRFSQERFVSFVLVFGTGGEWKRCGDLEGNIFDRKISSVS